VTNERELQIRSVGCEDGTALVETFLIPKIAAIIECVIFMRSPRRRRLVAQTTAMPCHHFSLRNGQEGVETTKGTKVGTIPYYSECHFE